MATQLVGVEVVSPFTGSYVCELAEADYISEEYVQDQATGNLIKRPIPRKKFSGKVPVQRWMTTIEVDLHKVGKLPKHIVPHLDKDGNIDPKFGTRCIENPLEPLVMVPADVAQNLVDRGLARYPQNAPVSLAAKLKPALVPAG